MSRVPPLLALAALALGGGLVYLSSLMWDAETNDIVLHIDTEQQLLTVKSGDLVLWQAPVSTSEHGLGEEEGSYKTPRGRHRVAEMIGDGEPLGSVFKNRRPTGEVWTEDAPPSRTDMILTRILWLAGDEPHNANSQERYIYFHGTNHEARIGHPASIGCIRLRNADMLRLYNEYARVNTPVVIE